MSSMVTINRAEYERLRAEVESYRAGNRDLQDWFGNLKSDYATICAEIAHLRTALNADPQTLRLHLGEMTAQEMRTLKAGFQWVLNCVALAQGGDK